MIKKGFSVAEAMIALLIGSIALGMAAPMITKQIKQNNFAEAQTRIINQQMSNLIENNDSFKIEIERIIEQKITEVQEKTENIPSGMVAFFNTTTCPNGWSAINANLRGRFPRFAGSYTVLDYDATKKTYKTTGTIQTLPVGTTQEDAIRNITGSYKYLYNATVPNGSAYGNPTSTGALIWETLGNNRGSDGAHDTTGQLKLDASYSVPIDIENRPMTVALLGCVKK